MKVPIVLLVVVMAILSLPPSIAQVSQQSVRPEETRVQPNAGDPLAD